MKRENILITENHTEKRVAAVKFVAPGDVPAFDCSIHFGEENDVTMQNCIIKGNRIVKCSPDDTYDFETGALIALMKMCGFDKSYKAIEEAFKYNSYDAKKSKVYEEKIRTLEKEKEQIIVAKNILYNNLEEENECLEEEKKHLKDKYERCQHILQSRTKDVHRLENEVIDLKTQIGLMAKKEADLIDKAKEFEEENKMLCDKIKFLDKENRNLVYGGRQNGKQYTFLVDLFKKLDQNKVDEAYKEAYNTKLPLWQKEVLKQMYDVYQESKEKTVDSLIEESRAFTRKSVDEWLYGPYTKRAEMWNDILACGDCEHSKYVEVKKEDLEAFAKECNEKKIFNVNGYELRSGEYWFDDDSCIFQIFRKSAGFICANRIYLAPEDAIIDYLPPMRWDLFKKGRIVVGVRKEHYDEFISNATKNIGTFLKHKPYDFNYTFFMYNKDSKFINAVGRSQFRAIKEMNNHKVIYWEDVR